MSTTWGRDRDLAEAWDSGRVKALLLENVHPLASSILDDGRRSRSRRRAGALDEDELIAALDGVQLLGIRSKTEVTAPVLDARAGPARGRRVLHRHQPDRPGARPPSRGIAVFNAPFSNTRSVVELALAEIIALTRRLTEKNAAHARRASGTSRPTGSHEVRGRTLGIVGYGNIGTQLSVLAETLGMQVYFYDTADKLALGNARRCDTLDELLDAVADVVTLHVDGRPGNAGLLRRRAVRPDAAAAASSSTSRRGFVVDHEALRDAPGVRPPRRRGGRRLPDRAEGRGDAFELRRCAACPT